MGIVIHLMKAALFVSAHWIALGLLLTLSYLYGRRLLRRFEFHSRWEELSFSISLGLGVIAYGIFFLGLMGWLYRSLVVAGLVAGVAVCYPIWREWADIRHFASWKKIRRGNRLILAGIVGLLFLPVLLLPLYPPTQFDATMYHLTYAKIYVQEHGLIPTPNLRYIVAPQMNEMLYTLALLFYDDLLAHYTQFAQMLLTAMATIGFGKRFFTSRAGWWGAGFWFSSPLIVWLGASAYVDIGAACDVFLGTYAFWVWLEKRNRSWLILAGVFGGLAIGVKLLGGFFVGLLGMVAIYQAIKARRYSWPIVFGGVALLVASPWLLRSAYYTGNPIYPLYHTAIVKFFGHSQAIPELEQNIFDEIFQTKYTYPIKDVLLVPWRLAFSSGKYQAPAPLSLAYPLSLPLILLAVLLGARFRGLGLLVLAYLPLWTYSLPDPRYLSLIMPFIGLITGASVEQLLRLLPWKESDRTRKALSIVGTLLLCSLGSVYAGYRIFQQGVIPITRSARDRYLANRLPSYPLYLRLNQLKGRDYTLYSLFDTQMSYFADGHFLGDWFGPARYRKLIEPQNGVKPGIWINKQLTFTNGGALYLALRNLGADHFLILDDNPDRILPQDEYFQNHFKLLAARPNARLYELSAEPVKPAETANLLENPGFEQVEAGCPRAWFCVGAPVIDLSGKQSRSGQSAVNSLGSQNTLFQGVPVTDGELYTLSFQARALSPNQQGRLQVNWNDQSGRFLATDIQIIHPSPAWQSYSLIVTPPYGARTAVIYASAHQQDSIWFDDFFFAQRQYLPAR